MVTPPGGAFYSRVPGPVGGGRGRLLPVDEVFLLQVLHGRRDLRGHVQQHHSIHLLPVALSQVVQQVPIGHELRDYIERGLPGADPCQRDTAQTSDRTGTHGEGF